MVQALASPALAIPTIQTSSTPIHQDERLGRTLVAHARGRRETRAVAGDLDVLGVVRGAGEPHRAAHLARAG